MLLATQTPETVVFLDELEAAGRTPATLKVYAHALNAFRRHLGPRLLQDAAPLDVRDFLDHTHSVNTRSTRLVVLRKFFRFLVHRGLLREDPTDGIPAPKVRRRDYVPVTEEEFQGVYQACGPQDRLLFLVLFRTGARIAETCGIMAEHISLDKEGGVINFPNRKGGESGFAAFGPDLAAALKTWLFTHPTHPEYLFPSPTVQNAPISPSAAYMRVVRAGRRAGLISRLTPHRLRHSFTTLCVDLGWPQLALQKQLGHQSPVATAFYYHPSRKGLRETYNRFGKESS